MLGRGKNSRGDEIEMQRKRTRRRISPPQRVADGLRWQRVHLGAELGFPAPEEVGLWCRRRMREEQCSKICGRRKIGAEGFRRFLKFLEKIVKFEKNRLSGTGDDGEIIEFWNTEIQRFLSDSEI
jgi:hypothetical protein